jgi:hypothetical protein
MVKGSLILSFSLVFFWFCCFSCHLLVLYFFLLLDDPLSYPVFMLKPSTHCMHDPGSIVPHICPKVLIDNQMPWIKYHYYISNVSKDYDNSTKRNSRRLHNSTETATGATRSLELFIEEFQSIFSFWAAGLSSRGNSKVEYTYCWYSASAGIKW